MERKKRRKKLTLQIICLIVPLFVILAGVNIWIMETSMVKAFLDSKNPYSEYYLDYLDEGIRNWSEDGDERLIELYLTICEKDPVSMRGEKLTDEEFNEFYDVKVDGVTNESDDVNRILQNMQNASDRVRMLAAKSWRINIQDFSEIVFTNNSQEIDRMFIMDMTEPYRGMVIADCQRYGEDKQIGEYFDLDLPEHPALQQIIETGSAEIVYEQAEDFPDKGHYYIAYKPFILEGKVRAVIGIVYRWDNFKDQMSANKRKAAVVIVIGVLLAMLLLYFALRRLAVKPVTDVENALIQYTDDKDSRQIVKRMYDIKVKNEVGYLADVISDLALEIDLYTKENVRIATERERAETARERAEKERARAEKELYEAKVSIMVSQIQPHFMYNALTSIAMLCTIDPERAQEATITFSKYLRGNMDSLKQTKPVPFDHELEHLKKYLYIEKLRFANKLNIEYEIGPTNFKVPQLSIQPLVENAVKHGVGMKKKGGTVKIATRETETAFEVIISDDGVGFDVNAPRKEDGRSHVGMENTRTRLKELCGGEVRIESTVGEGTTATVILPKEWEQNENSLSG